MNHENRDEEYISGFFILYLKINEQNRKLNRRKTVKVTLFYKIKCALNIVMSYPLKTQ